MTFKHIAGFGAGGLVFTSLCTARLFSANIPSPSTDMLLSSNGGVADINGSTADGAANYSGLPAANLNDGDRDGVYGNGGGVDAQGSIAHTAGVGADSDMGVTIPSPMFIGTVVVFNRTDCCGGRLDGGGASLFTLNVFNGATLAFTHDYTFTPTTVLTATNNDTASGMEFSPNVLGTYVQVVQHNKDYMNLAEIEAFVPEPATLTLFGLGSIGLFIRRR